MPAAHAATIKGTVISADDNSTLPSARIGIRNTKLACLTDVSGNFILKGIPAGNFVLTVDYIGYETYEKNISISIKDTDEVINLRVMLQPKSKEMNNVLVTGVAGKETETAARLREKNADNIVSVLSAQAIEKSPDITVANALQRVSGVSLSRTPAGDGQYAILRGMNKRYNNTLINGLKIASPDPKARFVPLDIIPSDLLQRIEVVKSITPDMEGDAIGGTVNIVMKDAPDSLLLNAYGSTSLSDLAFSQKFSSFNTSGIQAKDPNERNPAGYVAQFSDFTTNNLRINPIAFPPGFTGGVSFGDRFFNKKLGFISSVSMQDLYRASNGVFYNTTVNPNNNDPVYSSVQQRSYSIHQERFGFNNKFDYAFNNDNKLVFTAILLQSTESQYRKIIDTSLVDNRTKPGTGLISYKERTQLHEQLLGNFSLQGYHDLFDKLVSIAWTGSLSTASSAIPDQAELEKDYASLSNVPYFDHETRLWQHNEDQDKTGMLDLYFRPKISGKMLEFKFGGLDRDKTRSNYQNEYKLTQSNGGGGKAKDEYKGIDSLTNLGVTATGATPTYNINNYTVHENILAAYGEVKVEFGLLQVLTGVRMESTAQNYQTDAPPVIGASAASIAYNDFLPGLHLKYLLTPNQNLRFSVNKSISRPDYYDLVPYNVQGEYYEEHGNPNLTRTQATNYDLRYEYFASKFDHFGVGAFYKNILDPIEYVLYVNGTNLPPDVIKPGYPLIVPQSQGMAVLKGFEVTAIKYFGGFGLSGNYTFTQSQVNTPKVYSDSATHTVSNKIETRPLQGQSKNVANISAIYRNQKIGFHAQLSFVLTGSRLERLSPFYGEDYYTRDYYTLDFSAEQKISKHFIAFTKITNILNNAYEIRINNTLLVEKDYYGRFLQLGLRYRFN